MLRKLDYQVIRTSGSHMRLVSRARGREHYITIPAHPVLKVGTLNAILSDVASYLDIDRAELGRRLFDR
jgi:predicted RNA binding protein YcfA (HicA-like mRNA interferase family)